MQLAGAPALAATSIPLGSPLVAAPEVGTPEQDEEGLSHWRRTPRRTPSGPLHAPPPRLPSWRPLPGGLELDGLAELGLFWDGGEEREARFETYADWDDAATLRRMLLRLRHPERGVHAELDALGLGREDASARAELDWPGRLRLTAAWDRLPRAYAHDARSLYRGAGSRRLTLPPGLAPGSVSDAELASALASIGRSRLSVQRERNGASLELDLEPGSRLFARYVREARRGKRPFGGGLVFEVAPAQPARVVETIEPVDTQTQELSTGLRVTRVRWQANLEYTGSWFRNRSDTLTFDSPFSLAALNPFADPELVERGRFALAPDNSQHAAKLEAARTLPWRGRASAVVSWTRSRQNDELIPPTVNSGSIGSLAFTNGVPVPVTIDLDDWNRRDSRARSRADALRETWLLHAALLLRPWDRLRLRGRLRYFREDDRTRYSALNPRTGQIGYIAEDAAPAAVIPFQNRVFIPGQPSEDWRFRATPLGGRRLEAELAADARLGEGTRLGLRLERERAEREDRERETTRETRAALSLSGRVARAASWRVSYRHARRRGSRFDRNALDRFFVSSLPGFQSEFGGFVPPRGLAQLRRPDVADRDAQRLQLRVQLLLHDEMDAGLTLGAEREDYGASYGLREQAGWRLAVDWSWQPSPRWRSYAYATLEERTREQAGIADAGPISDDPNAGGPVFPFDRRWRLEVEEMGLGIGVGTRAQLHRRLRLELDYRFDSGRTRARYAFAEPAVLGTTEADRRLPDLRQRDHVLETSLRFELREWLGLRLYHRLQRSSIRDWAQRGIAPQLAGGLFLAHQDRDFQVSVFGVSAWLRL